MLSPKKKLEWTQGRVNAFITSALRAGMRRWPPKWEALEAACVGPKINPKSGRPAKHYTCAMCSNLFVAKDVEVDHILPVVDPEAGFTTWDSFIERLYCPTQNLQTLCKPCHKIKTSAERTTRKTAKGGTPCEKKTSRKPPSSTSSKPLKKSATKTPTKSGKPLRAPRKRTSVA